MFLLMQIRGFFGSYLPHLAFVSLCVGAFTMLLLEVFFPEYRPVGLFAGKGVTQYFLTYSLICLIVLSIVSVVVIVLYGEKEK